MSTWGELADLFLDITGHSTYAAREKWQWLTFARREIGARKNVRELFQPQAVQACTAGQDWIEIDTDVYAIISVFDTSSGLPLKREDSWVDRLRYCGTSGAPPEGELTHYFPWAKRLYLRATPSDTRNLNISFRFHPAMLTNADLALHPETPPQFDEALVWLAVSKYDAAHPSEASKSRDALGQAEKLLNGLIEQKSEEKGAGLRQSYVSMYGYGFNNR